MRRKRELGNLAKRLVALEQGLASAPGGREANGDGGGERLAREFLVGMIRATGHIRRAPLDQSREWGYRVERLRNLGPFSVAAYVAALRHLEHPDQDRAAEIFEDLVQERGVNPAPLEKLINLADRFMSSQSHEDGL